jgi:NADH-quinone oxidoreductase subunit L
MESLMLLVVVLPLLSALAIQLFAPVLQRRVARLSSLMILATFACAIVALSAVLSGDGVTTLSLGTGWAILLIDPLSALMAVVVSAISLIVHLYSQRYMAEESGYARFFILLDLMTGALLVMVSAGDLVSLLVAWHLVGVLLYFLLGQDTRSPTAYRYAFWTLITYRFGDVPLVLAAAVLYHSYGTWSLPELFAAMAEHPAVVTPFELPVAEVVGALVALSAYARSAQFLLHNWLPYTMGGPTPVSALMHAGIVNAGGFLINRFAPVFVMTTDVLHWVFIVGLVSALVGSMLMLTQHDIKKALGYSTMGQMGFMIMECGLGAFSLAVYHLIAHGVFKGTLFLSAGGVITDARKSDGVPKDDLYTFIVDRRGKRERLPWLLMAVFTLIVPGVVLFLAHYVVEQEFFHKQGAVVLLFFGWVTGAQLMFATYRMRSSNPMRQFMLIMASFVVVVLGYVAISHAFDVFLYPDPAFRTGLYAAAGIDIEWFDPLVIVLTAMVVIGWLLAYYADRRRVRGGDWITRLRRLVYRGLSRELYVVDAYAWMSRQVIGSAQRVNAWLRWG